VPELVGLLTPVIVIVTLESGDPKEATEPAVPATDGMNVKLPGSKPLSASRAFDARLSEPRIWAA
jgi:hypothetical protein